MSVQAPAAPLARPQTAGEVRAAFLASHDEATSASYGADLRLWFAFCRAHDLDPLAASRTHVEAFVREQSAQAATSTVLRRIAALAGFYGYARGEGLILSTPTELVRRPRPVQLTQTLGVERDELVALLRAAEASCVRDHALIALLGLNGLRVSEAVGADVGALRTVRGHNVLAVHRKGDREQLAVLASPVAALLERLAGGRRAEAPLFVADRGGRLSRQQAWRIVKYLARDAGIEKVLSPHSFRHGFVTMALDAGVPLRDVQDAAAHADPRTTRRYDRSRHALERHAAIPLADYVLGAA